MYEQNNIPNQVELITLESLNFTFDDLLNNKIAVNKALFAAVQQKLTPATCVIVYLPNTYKSLRYELFCLCRTQRTLFCIYNQFDNNFVPENDVEEKVYNAFEHLQLNQQFDQPVFYNIDDIVKYIKENKTVRQKQQQEKKKYQYKISWKEYLLSKMEEAWKVQCSMGPTNGALLLINEQSEYQLVQILRNLNIKDMVEYKNKLLNIGFQLESQNQNNKQITDQMNKMIIDYIQLK